MREVSGNFGTGSGKSGKLTTLVISKATLYLRYFNNILDKISATDIV